MWLGRFLDSRSSIQGNPASFSHGDAEQLISELNSAVLNDRHSALRRLSALALEQKPYVMLYQKTLKFLIDKRLKGLLPHPMWPEVWPIQATNLSPFRGQPQSQAPPDEPQQPLFKDFADPVAEPYE
jgi:hypothetical protein